MKQLFIALICSLFAYTASGQPMSQTLPNAVFYKKNGQAFATSQIPATQKAFIMFFDATCEHCQQVALQLSSIWFLWMNTGLSIIS
jgi:thioredoxin-related protein